LLVSAIYKLPEVSTATELGDFNVAEDAKELSPEKDALPVPAY
jgi:hypothetical protein